MEWMKAGRPRKSPQKPIIKTNDEEEESKPWTKKELALFTDGYVALAAAVINQCRKDHVKEEPELFRAILDSYAESMMCRLGEYQTGEQEADIG